MIVKNEEEHLANCLNSVKDLVDEIIIVDTGSTDRTKEIAESFGAKMFDFEWCDDFSAARNESLKHATGDWVLVLDADEVLAKEDCEVIRNLIQEDVGGYILIQRNYFKSKKDLEYGLKDGLTKGLNIKGTGQGEDGFISSEGDKYTESKSLAGWLETPIVRLFKKSEAKFLGLVHEDVSSSIESRIIKCDVVVHHFGKVDVGSWKKKWEYYEQLGKKKAEKENDYYAYFELGRQYLAGKKLKLAKEMFEKSITLNDTFWLNWLNLGVIALIEGNLILAEQLLKEARKLNPNVVDVHSNLGVVYAKKKEFQKAVECFVISLQLKPNQAEIYKNLGMCYHEAGDKEKAYRAFKKAIELNPEYKKTISLN